MQVEALSGQVLDLEEAITQAQQQSNLATQQLQEVRFWQCVSVCHAVMVFVFLLHPTTRGGRGLVHCPHQHDSCGSRMQCGTDNCGGLHCGILQVKDLALQETEAAAAILSKAERLIKSLAQQREQQRERERQAAAAGDARTNQETVLRAQMADLQVCERGGAHMVCNQHRVRWRGGGPSGSNQETVLWAQMAELQGVWRRGGDAWFVRLCGAGGVSGSNQEPVCGHRRRVGGCYHISFGHLLGLLRQGRDYMWLICGADCFTHGACRAAC